MAFGSYSSTIESKVWSCTTGWSDEEQFSVIAYWQYAQDAGANKTRIKLVKLRFQETRQNCLAGSSATLTGGWTGSTATGTVSLTQNFGPPYWVDVTINKTKDFANDSNGNATGLYIEWLCSVNSSDYRVPKMTSLQRYSLPTAGIPKLALASALSVNKTSMNLGETVTCTITAANTDYTHKLEYRWFSDNTIFDQATTKGSRTVNFTPPISWSEQLPNSTSSYFQIVCYTYSGSTQIGQSVQRITVSVPSSVVPSIGSVTLSEAEQIPSGFTDYIQGKSKIRIVTAASGAYGSTITNANVYINGQTLSGTDVTTPSPVQNAGNNLTCNVTVTDSRGRTATYQKSYTVHEYAPPQITAATAVRCTQTGVLADSGTYAKISYSYSIAPLGNKNSKSFKIEYKRTTATSWTSELSTTSAYTGNANRTGCAGSLTTDGTYQIRFTASDSFSSTVQIVTIAPAFVLLHLSAGGHGIGIGKSGPDTGIACGIPLDLDAYPTVGGHEFFSQKMFTRNLTNTSTNLKTAAYGAPAGGHQITIPAAGWYYVKFRLTYASGSAISTASLFALKLNPSGANETISSGSGNNFANTNCVIELNAMRHFASGDVIGITIWTSTANTVFTQYTETLCILED